LHRPDTAIVLGALSGSQVSPPPVTSRHRLPFAQHLVAAATDPLPTSSWGRRSGAGRFPGPAGGPGRL